MNMSTIMQEYQKEVSRENARKEALARREALRNKMLAERAFSASCKSARKGDHPRYFKPSNHETRAFIESRMSALTKKHETDVVIVVGNDKWYLGTFEGLMAKNGGRYKNTWRAIKLVRMLALSGQCMPDACIPGAHKI